MELLITASIGLYKTKDNKYLLQVITAKDQNHYFIPITKDKAFDIRNKDGVSIEPLDQD